VNTGQQLGGAIGTSLLNTIAASATASYIAAHIGSVGGPAGAKAVQGAGLIHGYTTVFWWCAAIFVFGAIVCGALMRRGPLQGSAGRDAPAMAPTVAEAARVPSAE
jgi:hypothetical protein